MLRCAIVTLPIAKCKTKKGKAQKNKFYVHSFETQTFYYSEYIVEAS